MGVPQSIDYKQCIYGLKGPDGFIKYIGHARYGAERLALHKSRAKSGTHDHLPVYEWMHSIGLSNVKVEVIEKFGAEVPIEQVFEREKYWISVYREVSEMTNLTEGGFTIHLPSMVRGENHPRYGKKLEPAHKAAMDEGRVKAWEAKSDEEKAEWIEKMSIIGKGSWKNMSDESKLKMRENSHKGIMDWLAREDPEVIHSIKSRGPHVRHHVNNSKPNPECQHCQNEELV